ncbi:MAG: 16S rRNA (cytosine(967)-C(5))-methyltransferase RsmB [Magnetococcales bacterium]|nr:16S rRNA (cytosine(967)-C(5))-methyltransferase RsmB [Magnetococcales bacterium]
MSGNRQALPRKVDPRHLAAMAVRAVTHDHRRLEEALQEVMAAGISLETRDRALLQEIATGTIRFLNQLDHDLLAAMNRPLPAQEAFLWSVLRCGLYQIRHMRIPARAAVNEAVELVKVSGKRPQAGFVNAILRRAGGEARDAGKGRNTGEAQTGNRAAPTDPVQRLALTYAHPEWMLRRWQRQLTPEQLQARLEGNNRPGPRTLRVQTLLTTREAYLALLGEGGRACDHSPDGVVSLRGGAVESLPGFAEGWFAVQDEAAQLVSRLVAPRPGERILDACAAPGGKTAHLAALAGGQALIVAMDRERERLLRLRENLRRLRLETIEVVQGDAGDELPGPPFDGALVDAPCTGTGVIRRHPEIKWRRRPEDLEASVRRQRRLLAGVAAGVRPGGRMVYATCSLEPEENREQIAWFLGEHPEWRREPLQKNDGLPEALVTGEGDLGIEPGWGGMDGFFAARLRREG